ncbi:MAG: hypothetical protein RR230_05615 [Oscillospiraceae bacterium]
MKKTEHVFSKLMVVYCLVMCSVFGVWAMYIAARDNFLCTGVLTALLSVFGGELLLLCVKRLVCDKERGRKTDADTSGGDEGI